MSEDDMLLWRLESATWSASAAEAADRIREFIAELAERDAEIERMRIAANNAISLVEPWTTHCDYRAEPNLQRAVAILRAGGDRK